MNFEKSNALKQKHHALIPGGAHTYAKVDDQYPEMASGFLKRGKGCHAWDLEVANLLNMAWACCRRSLDMPPNRL